MNIAGTAPAGSEPKLATTQENIDSMPPSAMKVASARKYRICLNVSYVVLTKAWNSAPVCCAALMASAPRLTSIRLIPIQFF